MTRTKMTPADAAWLRMDRPDNLMVVNSVLLFDKPVMRPDLEAVLRVRLVERFARFRQRVSEPLLFGRPRWEDAPDFRIDDHIHHVRLPRPASEAELQRYVGDQMAIPLTRDRPLWEVHLIENFAEGGAVLFRMHHCIADGVAIARVLLSLTDSVDPGAHFELTVPPSLRHRATRAAAAVLSLARHPSVLPRLARMAPVVTSVVAKDLFSGRDVAPVFSSGPGITKHAMWSDPIPLVRIKEAAHARNATVNDLLLAAVAGALREYVVTAGEAVRNIRAMVPFNLRPLDGPLPRELGNRFGLVLLDLPLAVADRDERLEAVRRAMAAIKSSPEGALSYGILTLMGLTAAAVEHRAVEFFATKASGVITNVPGPRAQVSLAGNPVTRIIGWGPRSGRQGLGVAIFSYNGSVTVGFAVDAHIVDDPDRLMAAFRVEVDAYVPPPVPAAV